MWLNVLTKEVIWCNGSNPGGSGLVAQVAFGTNPGQLSVHLLIDATNAYGNRVSISHFLASRNALKRCIIST